MKKNWILLLSFALVVMICVTAAYAQSSGFGVGLTLIERPIPIINFTHFTNNSCSTNENPMFNYNVNHSSNISSCKFYMNNELNSTNDSVKPNTTMNLQFSNLPFAKFNLTMNCTDIFNVSTISVFSFSVNSFKKFNGTSTNFSKVDCRNISNFVVENTSAGRINFSESIDLSHGFDLDRYVNISFNKIELDSDALSALNKTATLQIVGLTFSNPRILFNGVVCPETICKKISYSDGVLTFNVSHWTSYESEETPSPSPSGGGGATGGGGGGGSRGGGGPPAAPVVTDFTIDKAALKVVLKQGQQKTETFSIKNTGTTIFDVKAFLSEIEKFKISPEEHEVTTTLQPNEEKTIELVFKALADEKPDIYPSRIRLKSPSAEKEIDTVVEVDSAEPLFDVDVEVLPNSKSVFPGQEVLLEVNLFNVRGFGRVDVSVEYAVKDFKGNVVAAEHETIAVETQAKFSRSLLVPSDLVPGNYVALVKVIYGDSIGTSSDIFEVKAKSIRLLPIQFQDYRVILFGGAAVMIAALLIFSAYKFGYLKKKAPKSKEEGVKQLKGEEKAQKLSKELEALEKAYKSGFISEESYQKDRKRVEEKLKSVK